MRCTMGGDNARLVAKAVQSLSKIGNDLFIEADKNGLQLRSINQSQSAVGSISFKRTFFDSFELTPDHENYCKLTMKACLGVFRSMKQVERCELRLLSKQCKFQVQLICKHETLKNALISIVDEQNVTAAVSMDNVTNTIVGAYKTFLDILCNFNTVEEELTVEAKDSCLTTKNYIEGSRVNHKFMRSQLTLNSTEFRTYDIEHDTTITFCLREFRAFLQLAEALKEDIILKFSDAGMPFFLQIEYMDLVSCLLIMSTLCPDDFTILEEYNERDITNTTVNLAHVSQKATQKRKNSNQTNRSTSRDLRRRIAEDTTISNSDDTDLFQFNNIRDKKKSTAANEHNNAAQSVEVPRMLLADGDTEVANVDDDNLMLITVNEQVGTESGPQVTFYNTEDTNEALAQYKAAPDNADEESVPQSPERGTSMRRIFSRCFQTTYVPREPSPNSVLYAANSDIEI